MSFTCLALSIASLDLGRFTMTNVLFGDMRMPATPIGDIENHESSTSFMISVKSKSIKFSDFSDDDLDDRTSFDQSPFKTRDGTSPPPRHPA
ncbi:Aste57867_3941 [Aphanomyces stellatus]|uniref:Aste57867_3941 protein n=1 Tax=Aphanomyces stellatus TaxID=120398 RepID=A0A485KEI7_9STRA|nr:hypothetical protein As57867_003930 [Aphanomyces stellatus]VFT81078.1 Aste57867_3941 [Aphanomyces stellatus]